MPIAIYLFQILQILCLTQEKNVELIFRLISMLEYMRLIRLREMDTFVHHLMSILLQTKTLLVIQT